MSSMPSCAMPARSSTVICRLAAKSAAAFAPRDVATPALVRTGHCVLEKLVHSQVNRFAVEAFAIWVALDAALPSVVPLAMAQPSLVSVVGRQDMSPVVAMPDVV